MLYTAAIKALTLQGYYRSCSINSHLDRNYNNLIQYYTLWSYYACEIISDLGLETENHSYLEPVPPLNEKLPKPNDFQFLNIHSSTNAELLLSSDATKRNHSPMNQSGSF